MLEALKIRRCPKWTARHDSKPIKRRKVSQFWPPAARTLRAKLSQRQRANMPHTQRCPSIQNGVVRYASVVFDFWRGRDFLCLYCMLQTWVAFADDRVPQLQSVEAECARMYSGSAQAADQWCYVRPLAGLRPAHTTTTSRA